MVQSHTHVCVCFVYGVSVCMYIDLYAHVCAWRVEQVSG